jgi:hypothetical protein
MEIIKIFNILRFGVQLSIGYVLMMWYLFQHRDNLSSLASGIFFLKK